MPMASLSSRPSVQQTSCPSVCLSLCPSSISCVDADGDDTFFSTFMAQLQSSHVALARGNFRILKAKVACEVRAPLSTPSTSRGPFGACVHAVGGVAHSLQCAPQIMRCYVNAVAAAPTTTTTTTATQQDQEHVHGAALIDGVKVPENAR